MPSLVSSSSLVAKLPRVTTTFGSMNSSCASRYGRHASISSGLRVAVAGRAALHDVGDVDVVAGEADPLDEAGEQLPGAADERHAGEVLLLPGALAHEHQVGVRVADAEHHLGAGLGERALRARRAPRARGRRTRRTEMVRAATRRDTGLSGCRAMVRDRIADRLGRHLGDHHPQAVEVRVDRAGRAARTRGRRRGGCATGGWRAPGRGARCGPADGTRPSSTGRWWRRPPAWCWSRRPTRPPRSGARVGEARRVGRRAGAGEQAAVARHDVADRVHHRERADDHVAVTC